MDMNKNVEMNTAIVSANNTLSTAVQQPAAPAPTDTEIIETNFVEQAPAAVSATEKKQDEKPKKTEKHKEK